MSRPYRRLPGTSKPTTYKCFSEGDCCYQLPLQIDPFVGDLAVLTKVFVEVDGSPAAPTNDDCISATTIFFLLRSLTPTREKKVGRSWGPPKNCSSKGRGFGLKFFGGKLVESKKLLFQAFN